VKAPELYTVLGVEPGAALEEIRASYRRLVKQLHPDITGSAADARRLDNVVDAYRALVKMQGGGDASRKERDIFSLGRLATGAAKPELRAFAVKRLGNSGKKAAYGSLKEALRDESEPVVISALHAIGQLNVLHSAGELGHLFVGSSEKVKSAVLDAIEQMKSLRPFYGIIVAGMKDYSPAVRRRCLSLFARYKKGSAYAEESVAT